MTIRSKQSLTVVGKKQRSLRAKLRARSLKAITRKDYGNQRVITFPQHIHNTRWQGVTVLLEESCGVIFNLRKSTQNQIQERHFSLPRPNPRRHQFSPHETTVSVSKFVKSGRVVSLGIDETRKQCVGILLGEVKTDRKWFLFFWLSLFLLHIKKVIGSFVTSWKSRATFSCKSRLVYKRFPALWAVRVVYS